MTFVEAPTTFYLGRRYDPAAGKLTEEVVYYDSRDLTTHAVVLGMTGSGKTGLCIDLLEEAILDNLPALIIDPKGDITNLLLNFPDFRPEDFAPWVNVDDARRANMDVPEYAAKVANDWRAGLEGWGIGPERMRWLQQAAQFSIYTPGSDAGLPVSILASLNAPADSWDADPEANRERVNGTVSALLALVGVEEASVSDTAHVLLSNIFEASWRAGVDLTLETVIQQVRNPPFEKLGVYTVDEYIPARDREKLARSLNGMIASPSFQSWMSGDPLDIPALLYTPDGRPRVSIFYTAHLSETERQFITTLLLEGMVAWMRTLSGTTSLRALLYIDELFGYFPPHPLNPPPKEPLLRLLKQARAFGIGVVLATQNPGDLDYKGLTNCGTWFIGRLQAERDREKVTEGLQLASAGNAAQDVNQLIAQIPPRTFIMNNIHERDGSIMMSTRWAMSLLRGPLTRQQITQLMKDQKQNRAAASVPVAPDNRTFSGAMARAAAAAPPAPPVAAPAAPAYAFDFPAAHAPAPAAASNQTTLAIGFSASPPAVPTGLPQYFVPPVLAAAQAIAQWQQQSGASPLGAQESVLVYRPGLLAQATVRFQERKARISAERVHTAVVPELNRTGFVAWDDNSAAPVDPRAAGGEPQAPGQFGSLPEGLTDSKRLTELRRDFVDHLFSSARLAVPYNPTLELYGSPDADEAAFKAQAAQAARERRDAEMDALTEKYERQIDALEAKVRRKEQQVESEKRDVQAATRQSTLNAGEAIIGLLRGRTSSTLSRISRGDAARQRAQGQLELAELDLQKLNADMAELRARLEDEVNALNDKWAAAAVEIESMEITPLKKDISLDLFGVGWQPFWLINAGGQAVLLPAR